MEFNNKVVLITGGTGSFGKKLIQVLLEDYNPQKVIVFSRDELKQHEMRVAGFTDSRLRYFIGDVRDVERMKRAMRGVDIVVHAAALKQVPAAEYNPSEAIKTNIIGAMNVIDAALENNVSHVLAMSTDKAAAPVNLYGATKLVSEKLFIQANSYSAGGNPRFSCVRYGNVVGSRGSVVPVFKRQRESGTITITDDRMTRFWITLDQGVRFVISCVEEMHGGEVFIPKIPSMRIPDLAKLIAPECDVKVIGIRPGEKLHETMVTEDEARQTVELDDRYIITPTHPWWREEDVVEGQPVPDGFHYSSDTNTEWLSDEQMLDMIDSV